MGLFRIEYYILLLFYLGYKIAAILESGSIILNRLLSASVLEKE